MSCYETEILELLPFHMKDLLHVIMDYVMDENDGCYVKCGNIYQTFIPVSQYIANNFRVPNDRLTKVIHTAGDDIYMLVENIVDITNDGTPNFGQAYVGRLYHTTSKDRTPILTNLCMNIRQLNDDDREYFLSDKNTIYQWNIYMEYFRSIVNNELVFRGDMLRSRYVWFDKRTNILYRIIFDEDKKSTGLVMFNMSTDETTPIKWHDGIFEKPTYKNPYLLLELVNNHLEVIVLSNENGVISFIIRTDDGKNEKRYTVCLKSVRLIVIKPDKLVLIRTYDSIPIRFADVRPDFDG